MNYQLSFFDDAGRILQVREASFETEHKAMCWMWIAGAVGALNGEWSVMELHSEERCVARVPAKGLKVAPNGHPRAKHRVMIVGSDAFADINYEGLVRTAGCLVAELFFDNASAEDWLSTHSPGAAIIEVSLGDKSCIALARKLAEREIPFLVVSKHSADLPGVDRIFRPVPWFEKPVTSVGLQLALGYIFGAADSRQTLVVNPHVIRSENGGRCVWRSRSIGKQPRRAENDELPQEEASAR
jgi:hypothetical protein